MPRVPDAGHPITENFAIEMHSTYPREAWPAGLGDQPSQPWERDRPEVREAFRDLARRFMAGDESVAPWRVKAGL